jgi:DNA-binding CsgD family transcriptional regulator
MDKLMEILNQRSSPGVILFDIQGALRYINREAREIIPTLHPEGKAVEAAPSALPDHLLDFVEALIRKPLPDDPFNEPFLHSSVILSSWGVPVSLRGFLLRPPDPGADGHQYLVLVEMVAETREANLFQIQKHFGLSEREMEVLILVCAGCSNQEIAERLFISAYTVKDHLKHLKAKVGVASRSMLVAAVRNR